jgi:hypothetical protein
MLNGDAHHSLSWEVELRISRCRFIKDSIAQSITEATKFVHPFSKARQKSRSYRSPAYELDNPPATAGWY